MKRVERRRGSENACVGTGMRGEGKRKRRVRERSREGGRIEGREWVKERVEEGESGECFFFLSVSDRN